MEGDGDAKKQHRKRAAGPKSVKKTKKKGAGIDLNLTAKQRNPKAFAAQSVNKLRRQVARSQDKAEGRLHPLDVDRSSAEPPPVLVAVVGPPKVGKSTLVRCLVRNFVKTKISDIKGPITMVTGKKQRVTIVECNNEINSMIDIAKVCDLALLLIDASYGLEMEVMEFLEMCRTHGMPKIIGVLTHLDQMKNSKILKKTKKQMKHRIWTELYQGAKLFYLSGMINGEYLKTEVHNLARFVSVQKYRPIEWRASHPYILADRMEDVTDPELIRVNAATDRTICLYGYVRGTHFRNKSEIHIPGCGDLHIADMSMLDDPCPLAAKVKRSLSEKDRRVYAPWSGQGGIVSDRDAIYIDLGGSHALKAAAGAEAENPATELVSSMRDAQTTLNDKLASSGLRLFSNTAPVSATDLMGVTDDLKDVDGERIRRKAKFDLSQTSDGDDSSDDDKSDESDGDADDKGSDDDDDDESADQSDDKSDNDDDYYDFELHPTKKRKLQDADKAESDASSDGESEEDMDEDIDNEAVQWKADMQRKASLEFLKRKNSTTNWNKKVYGNADEKEQVGEGGEEDEEVGGLFRAVKEGGGKEAANNQFESTKRPVDVKAIDIQMLLTLIKDCFVTGKWDKDEDAATRLKEDDELDGDFVDLETGEVHQGKGSSKGSGKEGSDDEKEGSNLDSDGDSSDKEEAAGDEAAGARVNETPAERRARKVAEKRLKKKARSKAMFNSEYDDGKGGGGKNHHEQLREELDHQAQLNRSEFEGLSEEARIELEGFRPGLYVRVQINNMAPEFCANFDPTYPYIVGGLLSGEQNIGFVNTRLKKHRWHKKILKTDDPLIVSLGWRRFTTKAVYSMRDDNGRYRRIKYTPEHLHCYCTFWGPITPQGKGMLSIRDTRRDGQPGFRISTTGTVLEVDKTVSVVKKTKLIGTPFKIFSKTAFIKDMFGSELEVTKFEGAKIQTVSGIRGLIKKVVKEGAVGSFRATFEDKILLSDIVFLKAWSSVKVDEVYSVQSEHMLPPGDKDKWPQMKTVGQLRRERQLHRTVNPDHLYKPIERRAKPVRPLMIPRELQKQLPFRDKPKALGALRDEVQSKRVAVVREPRERKIAGVMKMLNTIYEQKRRDERIKMRERAATHQRKQAKIDASKAVKQKERAKHAYYLLGQAEKRKQAQQQRS